MLRDTEATRAIAREVLSLLLSLVNTPTVYSTRRGHAPPGWNDRTWKKIAPTIPGATKPRGSRWWIVTPEQLAAFERGSALPANDAAPKKWNPADALADAGLRRAGGAK